MSTTALLSSICRAIQICLCWCKADREPIGLAPEIPEDLYMLIKKAVAVRKHLATNRKDKDGKLYVGILRLSMVYLY